MKKLVREAEGRSVTVDRLDGSEKYFPDATDIFEQPARFDGEVPHHVLLLGKSHLLVFTNRAVHLVRSSSLTEFPYGEISYIRLGVPSPGSGYIRIRLDGNYYRSGSVEILNC